VHLLVQIKSKRVVCASFEQIAYQGSGSTTTTTTTTTTTVGEMSEESDESVKLSRRRTIAIVMNTAIKPISQLSFQ